MSEIILSNTQRKYIKEYTINDKRLRLAVVMDLLKQFIQDMH